MATSLPRVGIALGDPAGIGPEIALKAALDARVHAICRPLLFGDRSALEAHAKSCGIAAQFAPFASAKEARWREGTVSLVALDHFRDAPFEIGKVSAAHGRSAVDSARVAIAAALAGEVEAVVAAPQTEGSIKLAGFEFDGYPTFVARCTGVPPEDAFLMICFERDGVETRIVHTTLHVSLKRALDLITRDRVLHAVRSADSALRRLGVASPRIAVSGLNPHAGEGGLFGDEEQEVIAPAIADANANGILAEGPFGADTMFHRKGFDAYVVMFHDQGHITAKLLAFAGSAALTIGTPVLFSSVAHGAALDIAGKGRAQHQAMVEAITRLASRRGPVLAT